MSVYIQIRCKQKAPLHVIHSYISSERSYLSSVDITEGKERLCGACDDNLQETDLSL